MLNNLAAPFSPTASWLVVQTFPTYALRGSVPSNTYFGASQALGKVFEVIDLPVGTIIFAAPGGVFAVLDNERVEIAHVISEKHPFEKVYLPQEEVWPLEHLVRVEDREWVQAAAEVKRYEVADLAALGAKPCGRSIDYVFDARPYMADVDNGVIAPHLPEPDENGWVKHDTWVLGPGSAGVGDEAIGHAYNTRYSRPHPSEDGHFLVVDETYYVEPSTVEDTTDDDTVVVRRRHYNVLGQYMFTVCTDLDDVGGTEVSANVEYDDELHALFLWDYEDARALAERKAREDQRHTLLWEG